jgi:hypothetical protein
MDYQNLHLKIIVKSYVKNNMDWIWIDLVMYMDLMMLKLD